MNLYIQLPPLTTWQQDQAPPILAFALANPEGVLYQGEGLLHEMPASEKTCLIVAAADVSLFWRKLPKLSGEALAAALPNLLEGVLLRDPGVLVASSKSDAQGYYTLVAAATPTSWRWLKEWSEARPEPVMAVVESLCLPAHSAHLSHLGEERYALALHHRSGSALGLVLQLPQVIPMLEHFFSSANRHVEASAEVGEEELVPESAPAASVISRLLAFFQRFTKKQEQPEAEAPLVEEPVAGEECLLLGSSLPDFLVDTPYAARFHAYGWEQKIAAANRQTLNLLPVKRQWGLSLAGLPAINLRLLGWGFLALLLVYLLGLNLNGWRLQREEAAALAEQRTIFQQRYPSKTLIGSPLEEIRRLTEGARQPTVVLKSDVVLQQLQQFEQITQPFNAGGKLVRLWEYGSGGITVIWRKGATPKDLKDWEEALKQGGFKVKINGEKWLLSR